MRFLPVISCIIRRFYISLTFPHFFLSWFCYFFVDYFYISSTLGLYFIYLLSLSLGFFSILYVLMVKLKLPILNNFSFLLLALKATRFPLSPDLSALLES